MDKNQIKLILIIYIKFIKNDNQAIFTATTLDVVTMHNIEDNKNFSC